MSGFPSSERLDLKRRRNMSSATKPSAGVAGRPGEPDEGLEETIEVGPSGEVGVADKSSPSIDPGELGHATTLGLPAPTVRPSGLPSSGRWSAARLPLVPRETYAVEGEVAQGGIGRVLSARDARLDRRVALKELIDPAGASEDRFVREALLTARLAHPSIVPVYEAGRWPSGEPFYSMKLVSGRPLSDIIEAARGLDERLPLLPHVLAVAEAVAFAHGKHIIHRDLKPQNVLVGEYGEVLLIDWGLAKDLRDTAPEGDSEGASSSGSGADGGLTMTGSIMGTPAYMPPEQAAGEAVDERADVYALGAILYEVLCGKPPYAGYTGMKILERVLLEPPAPLRKLQPGIPLDLLAIVDKAMAREKDARYARSKALAEDLKRFLAGQLVGAHQYSPIERAKRFVRRNRAALAVAVSAACVFVTAGALGLNRIVEERDHAAYEQKLAEVARNIAKEAETRAVEHADELTLVEARAAVARDPNEALAWLKTLSPTFSRWSAARVVAAEAWARGPAMVLRGAKGVLNGITVSRDGKLIAGASDDHTIRLYDPEAGTSRVFEGHEDEVWHAEFSRDDKTLISTSKDRTIRLWDIETGALKKTLRGHTNAVIYALDLGDGRLFSHSDDGTTRLWDVEAETNRVLAEGADDNVKALIGRSGKAFISAGYSGAVFLHDIESGSEKRLGDLTVNVNSEEVGPMYPMMFLPRGELIAAGGSDGIVRIWDPRTEQTRALEGLTKPIARIASTPDGGKLAAIASDGSMRMWDVASGVGEPLPAHESGTMVLSFSPDGKKLVSGGFDKVARVLDLATGEKRRFVGMRDSVSAVLFLEKGKRLAVASSDGTLRIFPLDLDAARVLGKHGAAVESVAISPSGDLIVSGAEDGSVWVWPVKGDTAPVALAGHSAPVTEVLFSPSGAVIATASSDGAVRLFDVMGHDLGALPTGRRGNVHIAFSPDSAWLAVGDSGGVVRLWNVELGEVRILGQHERYVTGVAFSPDGSHVGSASVDKTARVWDLHAGEVRVLAGHDDLVDSIAFSPNGAIVATGSKDHRLRLWDPGASEPRVIDSGGYKVADLAFTRDGSELFGTGEDSVLRVWDVARGAFSRILRGHAGRIQSLRSLADGTIAVTGSDDKTVRLWDVKTGESRVLGAHGGPVRAVDLAPDGSWAVSGGDDGIVKVWEDNLPREPDALRAWIMTVVPDTIEAFSVEDETVP